MEKGARLCVGVGDDLLIGSDDSLCTGGGADITGRAKSDTDTRGHAAKAGTRWASYTGTGRGTVPETEHAPEQDGQETPDVGQTQNPSETPKPEQTPDHQPDTPNEMPEPEQPVVPMLPLTPPEKVVFEEEKVVEGDYELYPKPQEIVYREGSVTLEDTVDVVFENGIDSYTEQRAKDTLEEVNVDMRRVQRADDADLLVGIYNNTDTTVDDWFKQQMGGQKPQISMFLKKRIPICWLLRMGKLAFWARIPIRLFMV